MYYIIIENKIQPLFYKELTAGVMDWIEQYSALYLYRTTPFVFEMTIPANEYEDAIPVPITATMEQIKEAQKNKLTYIKKKSLLNATIEFGGKTIKVNKEELELLYSLRDHLTLKIDRKEYTESSTLTYRTVDDSHIKLTRADFEDILIAGEDNRQILINKQFTAEDEIDFAYTNAVVPIALDLQTMFDTAKY